MSDTYKLNFSCMNCKHKWNEKIKAGYRVTGGLGAEVFDGTFMVREIICPNCKLASRAKKV